MGEVLDIHIDGLQNGFGLKSKGRETTTAVGDNIYMIGGTGDDSESSIGVRVYGKSSGEWVSPIVIGTKPKAGIDHSAVLLNDDRILIIKRGSTADDCVWFLEVNTEYVREQKKTLGEYVVAWSKGSWGEVEKPVVISGPSGVGKGTLISMLMKDFPSMFGFSVSHTTRAPRVMEKDGVHYHFSDRTMMQNEIKYGKFLEYASVHGNLYGTSIEAVEVVSDSGKRCILDIDVQGARLVRDSSLEAVFVFICPPSMEDLEKRLRARGTETEEQIQKRLRNAKEEHRIGKSPGLFDHLLENDNLEECYENLKRILRLDGVAVTVDKQSPKGIELPSEYTVSKIDNKVLINCATLDSLETSKNLTVLDVSSLQGGAPGRTRGLNIYAIDSFSDSLDSINHLT